MNVIIEKEISLKKICELFIKKGLSAEIDTTHVDRRLFLLL
jgi:hypothetical protein